MTTALVLGPTATAIAALAGPLGVKLTAAPDAPTAVGLAAGQPVGLVFCPHDVLPTLLPALKAAQLNTPVVAIGPATPALGVKAIRLGAIEYLTEPLDAKLVNSLLRKIAAPAAHQGGPQAGPVAVSPAGMELFRQAAQYAASTATVLLRGESGTGKEVLARYIHAHSPRKNAAFVAVNCAAIPENMLESELFGFEKGAFTGALAKRVGKFEAAHGGTLLLDEISEMDLGLQAKLLRAIQERVIDPIGADKPTPVDIRLIATTNRNLEDYVAAGKFREDLYFRLNVVALELPPLRARPEDIEPLALHFARSFAAANGLKTTPSFAPAALEKLKTCYWKGNVRELENTIQRAMLLAAPAQTLGAEHVVLSPMSLQMMSVEQNNAQAASQPLAGRAAPLVQAAAAAYAGGGAAPGMAGGFVPKRLADAERDVLSQTLHFTRGNREIAADILGISLLDLKNKLANLGLS